MLFGCTDWFSRARYVSSFGASGAGAITPTRTLGAKPARGQAEVERTVVHEPAHRVRVADQAVACLRCEQQVGLLEAHSVVNRVAGDRRRQRDRPGAVRAAELCERGQVRQVELERRAGVGRELDPQRVLRQQQLAPAHQCVVELAVPLLAEDLPLQLAVDVAVGRLALLGERLDRRLQHEELLAGVAP